MELSFLNILLFILAVLVSLIVILSGRFTYIVLYPKVISLPHCFRTEIEKGWVDPAVFAGLKRENLTISSQFGYLLQGEFIPNEGSTKTIILSHGISSNRYGMIRYIPLFQEMGFNILIYDMRGHGASGGGNITYGFYEKHDLKSVLDWLIQKYGKNMLIGTMGVSLGAAVSLQHASIDSRVSFTIAEAAFSDFSDLLVCRLKDDYHLPPFPFIPLATLMCRIISGMDIAQISPIRSGSTIHTPVFLIHGETDSYIPPEMSLNIFNSLTTAQKGLYFASDAGHSSSLRADPEEYKRQVTNFLVSIDIL